MLIALVAVGMALVATLLDDSRGAALLPGQAQPPMPQVDPLADEPVSPALRYQIGEPSGVQPLAERPALDSRPSFPAEQRFAGTGRIEGRLALLEGTSAPQHWTLVLQPSRALIGGDRARGRRVEFQAGELEFELEDVPLGGYEIWAEAQRMSGRHEHLLLARPDSQLVYQDLVLVPTAYVEGRVTMERAGPLAGLPVFLVPLAGGEALAAACDAGGHYFFEAVPDGEYRLELGFRNAPLAEPRELAVLPPSLHMPDLSVPELFELEVVVLSDEERPVEGALVRGWCSAGGLISMRTDARGWARARWLPAGRVTLTAEVPEERAAGLVRTHLDFPSPDRLPVELRLRR